jgi:hypothetical protein
MNSRRLIPAPEATTQVSYLFKRELSQRNAISGISGNVS